MSNSALKRHSNCYQNSTRIVQPGRARPGRAAALAGAVLTVSLLAGPAYLFEPVRGMAATATAVPLQQRPQQTADGTADQGEEEPSSNTFAPPRARWTDNRCGNCHRPNALSSHPVGVRAGMKVPDDLPLDNGRITCLTCHNGDDSEAHGLARQNGRPLLRGDVTPAQLCARCHESYGDSRRDAHANALQTAHLGWDSGKPSGSPDRFKARGEDWAFASDLDMVSQTCMACHDDLNAPSGTGDAGPQWAVRGTGEIIGGSFSVPGAGSHPVGVRMDGLGSNRLGAMEVKSGFELRGSDMQLVDGMVSCVTCHSLYSRQSNLLVMSNERSQLCFSCHMD
ncbi:MAG: hypothetical protein HND57_05445 [Planctomycetes bacterium]|nr:hypothetical protein [Planctomycetota bacterium]